jgi:hypothetical protein
MRGRGRGAMGCRLCETRRCLRQLVGGFKDASPPCTYDRRLSPKTTHANLTPPIYPATVRSTRAMLVIGEDREATPPTISPYRGRLVTRGSGHLAVWTWSDSRLAST